MTVDLLSLQTLLCCLAFFFAGIVDSITGGGGLITIPAMLAVGIPVHYITGTNQCSAWLGTGLAAYKYLKSGNIHLRSAVATLPFAILGSYFGARLNLMVPDRYLKTFMLVTVPIIAVFIFANRKLGEEDHADEQPSLSIVLWSAVIGIVLGGYQGFYGPGVGVFFMLAYAACLKLNLVRATGNTRFVIAIASVTSVITYAASGAVLWKLAAAVTVFNMAGSYLGAALAIKNGARIIRPIMFCVVALLIIKLVIERGP
ncbi:MAG: TSUP family transporter [Oscillospiraceae bacterium]|nr:TSUP family transporter [Oscillospiraceae bacterium]